MRLLALLVLVACGKHEPAIAELKQADAPVEKQTGDAAWDAAPIGTEYRFGDAARTGDGGAQLELTGGARIAMQTRTVLRFGGKAGANRIAVEAGAIELSGTGSYGLDIGEVTLSKNGTVRITAGDGHDTVQLTLGEAKVSTLGGQTIDLVLNTAVEIGLGDVVATPLHDAAPRDAPVVAVADAAPEPDAPPAATSDITIDVTGKTAERLPPGATRWAKLPAGSAELDKGSKVRLGAGTTAKLVAHGTMLELGGGTRVAITDADAVVLELGGAHVTATADAKVELTGGAIAMTGTPATPAEARLDAAVLSTKVVVQRGAAKLTGTGGSELAMNRGESATLLKSGVIRPLEAIPQFFDFRAVPGESFTVHDPKPPTAIQFQFAGKCSEGGIVELDKDARFRTAKVSAGKESANHLVHAGSWHYRLRCTTGNNEGGAVASGVISVIADGGTRSLPPKPGVNPFVIDGRPWSFSYQSAIPDLAVTFPGGGGNVKLHLARAGKDLTFDGSGGLRIPGSALSEGTYTYWFDRDGVKQDKLNTLKIDFDQTAPQVYIESPVNARPWSGDLEVRGAVLPGWTAGAEGASLPIDPKTRRFNVKVGTPPGNALAIRLAHPQRGVHYYLRRQK